VGPAAAPRAPPGATAAATTGPRHGRHGRAGASAVGVSIVAAPCRRHGRNRAAPIGVLRVPASSGRVATGARAAICRSPTAANACPRLRSGSRRPGSQGRPVAHGLPGPMIRAPSGSFAVAVRWPRSVGTKVHERPHANGPRRHPSHGPRPAPSAAIRQPPGPSLAPSAEPHLPRGPSLAAGGVLRRRPLGPSQGVRVLRRPAARRRVETEAEGEGSRHPHDREGGATIAN
jgi:hypothetical protein